MSDPHYAYPLLGAMVLSMILSQWHHRSGSPLVAIINRWLRWLIFAFGAAYICRDLNLLNRPYLQLVAVFFLVWLLGQTLYNWLAIHALSVSPLPLFPRYAPNQSGEEWPTQPRLLKVREWLRARDFQVVQSLKAEVASGLYLRVSVYQDRDARVRIQVMFLPQPGGSVTMCYVISSRTTDGFRYVTDNLFLPFGGFYPENWLVERDPWRRSVSSLLARHEARLAAAGAQIDPWAVEPATDLNLQQGELDRLNTELGFLRPHHEREDFGKITSQGRYRVWKEIWMLDYLGRSTRYL